MVYIRSAAPKPKQPAQKARKHADGVTYITCPPATKLLIEAAIANFPTASLSFLTKADDATLQAEDNTTAASLRDAAHSTLAHMLTHELPSLPRLSQQQLQVRVQPRPFADTTRGRKCGYLITVHLPPAHASTAHAHVTARGSPGLVGIPWRVSQLPPHTGEARSSAQQQQLLPHAAVGGGRPLPHPHAGPR